MKGIKSVRVSNGKVSYKFDIRRNITVVRGKSGSGKTTLYDMIAEYTRLRDKSGVSLSCPCECVALVDIDWKNQLANTSNSIVFIDEGAGFVTSREFATFIRDTDNYYVFFNRENLYMIPYSISEVYEIKCSGRYHRFEHIYKIGRNRVFDDIVIADVDMDTLLTEDSKSGFQFFSKYASDKGFECVRNCHEIT
mgnify:CR=1 FL=1